MSDPQFLLKDRFRGYFPVIVDVETAGFNAQTDALLEVAAITTKMDADGYLTPDKTFHYHVVPFEGANLEKAALEFNGIDPWCALRGALDETEVMKDLCKQIRKEQKDADCQRSVMVAHNAAFDLGFINAAIERSKIKRTPFHPFVSFDTTTLAGLALGQTVLVKACQAANISFDQSEAHSALYDTQKTAELYCYIVNKWHSHCGWPIPQSD
ncbi:ribonuclease T [Paraglaciecola chathamensis]|jgi:ribonuclease T|uniref:Ribonuclease T n=3 Tax=Paraglaciecola chathamensis TaxID=368405 RepID=A0A8H9I8E9_9ALTE|nr:MULTISPECIES: ribonuclease T [Paraglaciecola]AEE23933.1 ribonuclease T [Glaciecola sp. 4H-3-7+YE-5]MBN25599.1 ribonuclease T [Alteromonadaceae bacterium]MBJ2138324.1 ribonuclease T [Paraglaciecola chathamensis]MBU3019134.1 ribonuclease T [Paraglaciecola agarilytica]MDO6560898.1 ribonuclease T [Paraglaciecola chathamensis]|tara:strand:+ start:4604 stop:5239 length:636 start_codon:yes stop_codon:yes gene_type:complete